MDESLSLRPSVRLGRLKYLLAKPVVVFLARAANNKQQLNGLRAHISEILGTVGVLVSSGGGAHFVIGFVGK